MSPCAVPRRPPSSTTGTNLPSRWRKIPWSASAELRRARNATAPPSLMTVQQKLLNVPESGAGKGSPVRAITLKTSPLRIITAPVEPRQAIDARPPATGLAKEFSPSPSTAASPDLRSTRFAAELKVGPRTTAARTRPAATQRLGSAFGHGPCIGHLRRFPGGAARLGTYSPLHLATPGGNGTRHGGVGCQRWAHRAPRGKTGELIVQKSGLASQAAKQDAVTEALSAQFGSVGDGNPESIRRA